MASLDPKAQNELLEEVEEVFTVADNDMLDKPISDKDVKASLLSANRNSSPGSDGITYLVYLTCWKAPRAAPERRHQRDRQGRQVARVHAELLLGVFSKIGE